MSEKGIFKVRYSARFIVAGSSTAEEIAETFLGYDVSVNQHHNNNTRTVVSVKLGKIEDVNEIISKVNSVTAGLIHPFDADLFISIVSEHDTGVLVPLFSYTIV